VDWVHSVIAEAVVLSGPNMLSQICLCHRIRLSATFLCEKSGLMGGFVKGMATIELGKASDSLVQAAFWVYCAWVCLLESVPLCE